MARKPKNGAAGAGHNSNLSQDDLDALAIHHLSALRAQDGEVAKAKATYDAALAIRTDLFRAAKLDGFTRKELSEILVDSRARHRDLAAEEKRRAWLRSVAGLPVGAQLDLFDERMPSLARDETAWRADGYQAGCRGEECKPPEGCPPAFDQAWLQGWNDGQAYLGTKLARAGEIIAERGKPSPEPAVELNDEDSVFGEDGQVDEEKLRKASRKLAKSGFMDRTPADQEPAAA